MKPIAALINAVKKLGKRRLNGREIIRCCASCERVFLKRRDYQGCPNCGFGHYGARFVYGDWAYFYILYRLVIDPFKFKIRSSSHERL